MAEINHEALGEAGLRQSLGGRVDARRFEVRRLSAAQDDVAILVARSRHDGGMPGLGHRQEVMRRLGGAYRVDGDLDVAVGAVLEAHRARQS
jgi:hypothetical protein